MAKARLKRTLHGRIGAPIPREQFRPITRLSARTAPEDAHGREAAIRYLEARSLARQAAQ